LRLGARAADDRCGSRPGRDKKIGARDSHAAPVAAAVAPMAASVGAVALVVVPRSNTCETPRVDVPEIRYARSGDISIAYQVVGDGPIDLVLVPGFVSNLELAWEDAHHVAFYRRLSEFSRLILFDKRGTGLSDRIVGAAPLEVRMDDVRAVMDAAGSARAAVLGFSEGAPMTALFAATYPERVVAIILCGGAARFTRAPDYPFGVSPEEFRSEAALTRARFGSPAYVEEALAALAPSMVGDDAYKALFGRYLRQSASPGAAAALKEMNSEIDVRAVLPTIRVPTLVMRRAGDRPEVGRYLADRIPGARFVELSGTDHLMWTGDHTDLVARIREFVASVAEQPLVEDLDTVLATVLFTDIVGSTAVAADLGDKRWRELLERHHATVRAQLARFRGVEIDTAGDGFFARFDGPARAIRCACAIRKAVSEIGLEVRAGVHTGECEMFQEKVAGLAVSIGARVAAKATPGEVLVSQTVRDLVAGSGLVFEERGTTDLKGVPGEWRLYAVAEPELASIA
jgi:class 3 adenylate cyclase